MTGVTGVVPVRERAGRTAVDRAQARLDDALAAYHAAADVVLGLPLDAGLELRDARLAMWALHRPVDEARVALRGARLRSDRRR